MTKWGEASAFFHRHLCDETDECVIWEYSVFKTSGYGKLTGQYVHVLACTAEHGPRPPGMEASHTCGSKRCFNRRHLVWETHAANEHRKKAHGTANRGPGAPHPKLTAAQVGEIRERYAVGGVTQRQLGIEFNVDQTNISRIIHRTRWKAAS